MAKWQQKDPNQIEDNMPDATVTLPFKVFGLFAGFAEGLGLAKATSSDLTLEFVIKETTLNVFKSGVKEIRIPQSEIEFVRHKQGWFGDKIRVRVKSLKWLDDLPGCEQGELILHVARRDRIQAGDLVRVLGKT